MTSRITSLLAIALIAVTPTCFSSQSAARRTTIAVLSFGESAVGRQSSDLLAKLLARDEVQVLDSDQAQAAALGAGYAPSLNMATSEARILGAAMGSDYFVLGDAQTLRRSPSSGAVYFESYASIFVVSSRTGRLVNWRRLSFPAPSPEAATRSLLSALSQNTLSDKLIAAIRQAQEDERTTREAAIVKGIPVIEEAPTDDKAAAAEGLRLPNPYRRLQPSYPDTAAEAEAEAIVDVLVDLDANGEVGHAEIARWAGFGLDEATLETVRRLHFFPAQRNGAAIPLRVLLRYNFRKPPK
jgi:TonB family protein